jgi:hypothetical protein
VNDLTSSTLEPDKQGHLSVLDEEEVSLPSLSFHDAIRNQVDWNPYNRLAGLELDHAASGQQSTVS